jgi:hypothetical protein
MANVDILPCGCWYWMGARSRGRGNRKWYGSFSVKGKTVRASRFSHIAIGSSRELAADEHRDHLCKFSMCVNPAHLEIVHYLVNQARRWNKPDPV